MHKLQKLCFLDLRESQFMLRIEAYSLFEFICSYQREVKMSHSDIPHT